MIQGPGPDFSLSPIIQEWCQKGEDSILLLCRMDTGFSFSFQPDRARHPYRTLSPISRQEKTKTLEALEQIFGKERIMRVLSKPDVKISKERWEKRSIKVTKKVARRLFAALAELHLSDIDRERPDNAFEVTNYFKHFEEVFIGKPPRIGRKDRVLTAPHSEPGRLERVWTILHTKHLLTNSSFQQKEKEILEAEFLTSRLADREPTQGLLIPSTQGYRYVDRVFSKGGAYIFATRSFDKKDHHVQFVCRGTAFRRKATGGILSGVNDLLPEIGSYGIQQNWQDIVSYLKEQQVTSADVLGKSLGGAHARYLALLLAGKTSVQVKTLSILCPVNIAKKVKDIYHSLPTDRQFVTHQILNGGDKPDDIPQIGETSWGDKITILGTTSKETTSFSTQPLPKKIWRVCTSLIGPHSYQHTMDSFQFVEITEPKELQAHLQGDAKIEKIRQMIGKIIHWITRGRFTKQTFSEFYENTPEETTS